MIGNFRSEIDKYKHMLEQEQSATIDRMQKSDALQKEHKTLVSSKTQLSLETEALRETLSALEKDNITKVQQLTERLKKEIEAKNDELTKETRKLGNLNVMIKTLKENEDMIKAELSKLKQENKTLNDKYKEQASEHAQTFAVRGTILLHCHRTDNRVETQGADQEGGSTIKRYRWPSEDQQDIERAQPQSFRTRKAERRTRQRESRSP